jgi:MFS family permease
VRRSAGRRATLVGEVTDEDRPMTAPSAAARGAEPRRQRIGGLLRQHDFRLFWTGETISQLGDTMARVAMPLLAVLVLHASTFVVTLLTATAYLPWLLIGLPVGAWVDRIRGRPLMIACDLVAAVLYGSLPVAAWLGVLTIGQVVVVALLAGCADVFFTTAYQVYLPSIVATSELVEGNAKLQGSASAAAIGGPGAAGLLAGTLGSAAALLANAVSFGVSVVCLLRIRGGGARATPAPASRMGIRREIADGVRYVAGDPYLRPLTIWASAVNLGLTGYGALAVVFLVRTIGLAAGPAGLLLATWLGVRSALWIMIGIAVLSGALLLTRTFRGLRDLPAGPARDAPAAVALA